MCAGWSTLLICIWQHLCPPKIQNEKCQHWMEVRTYKRVIRWEWKMMWMYPKLTADHKMIRSKMTYVLLAYHSKKYFLRIRLNSKVLILCFHSLYVRPPVHTGRWQFVIDTNIMRIPYAYTVRGWRFYSTIGGWGYYSTIGGWGCYSTIGGWGCYSTIREWVFYSTVGGSWYYSTIACRTAHKHTDTPEVQWRASVVVFDEYSQETRSYSDCITMAILWEGSKAHITSDTCNKPIIYSTYNMHTCITVRYAWVGMVKKLYRSQDKSWRLYEHWNVSLDVRMYSSSVKHDNTYVF